MDAYLRAAAPLKKFAVPRYEFPVSRIQIPCSRISAFVWKTLRLGLSSLCSD